jgi:hypothetical protein
MRRAGLTVLATLCVTGITDLSFEPSGDVNYFRQGNNFSRRLVRSMLRRSSKSSSTWISEMTRDAMDLQPTDDKDLLVEVSDQALEAACGGLMQGSPAEHAAPYRGKFWQHRNAYDGNGEYEFPTARHYVPQC